MIDILIGLWLYGLVIDRFGWLVGWLIGWVDGLVESHHSINKCNFVMDLLNC